MTNGQRDRGRFAELLRPCSGVTDETRERKQIKRWRGDETGEMTKERRAKWWKEEGKSVGKSKRACGGHANHQKWVEMKNLMNPCRLAGAGSSGWEGGRDGWVCGWGQGFSGAIGSSTSAEVIKECVYVCGVTLCFLCPAWLGPARQNWDRVSSACSGGPSPVDV